MQQSSEYAELGFLNTIAAINVRQAEINKDAEDYLISLTEVPGEEFDKIIDEINDQDHSHLDFAKENTQGILRISQIRMCKATFGKQIKPKYFYEALAALPHTNIGKITVHKALIGDFSDLDLMARFAEQFVRGIPTDVEFEEDGENKEE